jgi:cellulose synthase/poly-beta-1,6-N-acetylglucosamine synthase-like glycosyltransferase
VKSGTINYRNILTSPCINSTWNVDPSGLPLLWNQREKWLLFQVLTKEKWETTGRSGESTGRSQNISIINCTTFHIRGALSWHSYVIMYLLDFKVVGALIKMLIFFQIKYTMGDPDSMSMARSYYAQALKLNNKNVRALYGFFLVCSLIQW